MPQYAALNVCQTASPKLLRLGTSDKEPCAIRLGTSDKESCAIRLGTSDKEPCAIRLGTSDREPHAASPFCYIWSAWLPHTCPISLLLVRTIKAPGWSILLWSLPRSRGSSPAIELHVRTGVKWMFEHHALNNAKHHALNNAKHHSITRPKLERVCRVGQNHK